MSRLPVENLPARLVPLDLAGTEVHHLPDWKSYGDPKRMEIIRQIAMMRGRDPRIASLAVDIIKKAGVQPRDYKGQAAALLAWVQDPKNVYYINEPGERLQDPIFTITNGWGDCDDQIIVLTALFESIRLPWKLVLAGTRPTGKKDREGREIRKKVRYIEGAKDFPADGKWAHIFCMVGVPAFNPKQWFFCETTINKVPLGWDVIDGDKSYLPELDTVPAGPARLMHPPKAPARFRPAPLPPVEARSPAYALAYNQFQPSNQSEYGVSALSPMGAAVGASIAAEMEDGTSGAWLDWKKVMQAAATGVIVTLSTQLVLDWIRPKMGIRRTS